MFHDQYADRSFDDLAKVFGPGFARALVTLAPGSWQGPIESGYGWHLVFVHSLEPSRVPAFEEIEPEVKVAFVAAHQAQAKRKAYEAMRARYHVVLPEAAVGSVGGGGTQFNTAARQPR
jgi:parvulin-like peptidyl-prolyl isomerase